jgi:hypothetical protein
LRSHLRAPEPAQLQPARPRRGRDVGEEAAQPVAPVGLVGAQRGDDEQVLVTDVAREEGEQVERRAIGPVDVLKDEQHRVRRCRGGEAIERHRVRAGRGVREPSARCEDVGRVVVVEPAQRVDHRQQRDDRVLEPGALTGQDLHAASFCVGGELREQPGLADAGLAADERDRGRALRRARDRRCQRVELAFPAGEDGARDALRHVASMAVRAPPAGEIGRGVRRRYVVLPM